MLVLSSTIFVLLLAQARVAFAQIKPTTPGPNETYTAGSSCVIAWVPDTSGGWTNMTIDLMSGANDNMTLVTNVAMGLDGTNNSLSPYSWICPEVDPYSAIYFYQFTNGIDISSRTWTTRFTIASPTNSTVSPPNPQQSNGDAIPWGEGRLQSKAAAANSTSSGSNSSDTDIGSATNSETGSGAAGSQKTPALTAALPNSTETEEKSSSRYKQRTAAGTNTRTDYSGGTDSSDDVSTSTARTKTANLPAIESQGARASAISHGHAVSGEEVPASASDESSLSDPAPAGNQGASAQSQGKLSSDGSCRCYTEDNTSGASPSRLMVTTSPRVLVGTAISILFGLLSVALV